MPRRGFAAPPIIHQPFPGQTAGVSSARTVLDPPRPAPSEPYDRSRRFLAGHRLFAVVLTLAAALRVVTMLGFRPAQLYWYDSFTYLDNAVHMQPSGAFHPAGYAFLLWALRPFHNVEVISAVQHAMGLGMALMIYALLRRRKLPAWGATTATLPVLFDPSFLRLEHAVLSDTMVTFLIIAAITLLMWSPGLSARAAVGVGLLLALAAVTRTVALPLLVLALLYLAVRRAGWRTLIALAMAGLLPLAAYATWYHQHNGRFALSGADGVALWARTMTFANCAVIKPPPELIPLCPTRTWQDAASEYVWDANASLNKLPGGRFAHNDEARSFALRAIAAQPLDYLHDVVADTALAFAWTPVAHPKRVNPALGFGRGDWPLPDFPLIEQVRREYDTDIRGLHSIEPFAGWLVAYHYPNVLHGPLLGVILLLGALGAAGRRRAASLPWMFAMFLLIGPVAMLDFDHRYVLPAIPIACLAAALATADLRRRRSRT